MKNLSGKQAVLAVIAASLSMMLTACGGGGSSGPPPVYWPFQKINGSVCADVSNPKPGCTYNRDGSRVSVSQAQDYNKYGGGSNDLWYVKFDTLGNAYIYDPAYSTVVAKSIVAADTLPGFKEYGLTAIWFGNDAGAYSYRHDVTNGTYWLDQNWVLYNANVGESTYGKAINEKGLSATADMNFSEANSEDQISAQQEVANMLRKDYGVESGKATVIAETVLMFGSQTLERGYAEPVKVEAMFTKAFGTDSKSLQKVVLQSYADKKFNSSAIAELSKVGTHLGTSTKNTALMMGNLFEGAYKQYAGKDADDSWIISEVEKLK